MTVKDWLLCCVCLNGMKSYYTLLLILAIILLLQHVFYLFFPFSTVFIIYNLKILGKSIHS